MSAEQDKKVHCGPIAQFDAIRGMAHVLSYILLHLSYLGMNEQGESQWLNTLLVDIQRQDPDVVPDGGKRFVMGMIAAVEETLREKAESDG
jgi:hypothetical protein